MAPTIITPAETDSFDFGGLGVHWKLDGALSEGRFSVVHHPMAPRALAAPLHLHTREDEYSFVIKGRLGALLGDDVVTAGPGEWVCKPRNEWHTFWNDGDEPCEIIEIIAPAGFEHFFRELSAVWGDAAKFAQINEKYGLQMRFDSVPELCDRFGLTFPSV